ncbi:MAG: short-chain dehydrogenase [Candidatus Puniceispirillum sp. TMED52]|nr:short-chain dehydrogenase [SAR116 cluster bacterium]OUU51662.1 MAG: short-chain dehydrogenase [Candidatus Puniceispirillum sp. TMED52]
MPTTLITGGSKGIGLATVHELSAAGHEVVTVSRTPPPASARCKYYAADLSDPMSTLEALEQITTNHDIDNVVNNAGLPWPDSTGRTTLEGFDAVVSVNLKAAIIVTQACLPAMQAKGCGRVINISSRAALGLVNRNAYSAAKAGLIGLSRTWALELACNGITVNVIAPGPIETDLFLSNNVSDDERITNRIASIPVGRIGKPQDVATAIAFFLAPAASYITGQTLFVCGGTSIGSTQL